MQPPVSLAAPDLTGNEEAYVVEALRSTRISSTGPFVDRFEAEFAARLGVRHAVSVSNGTVALHLALLALGVGPGDEVIVPSLTYVATANAATYVGAKPVFVDVDPKTWCMEPDDIRRKVTPATKAIIPVHLYGHPAPMDEIMRIAEDADIWVIEDAAEGLGATYRGRPAGSLGHVATFSFYGNKVLTSGEGGCLTTSDDVIAARARQIRGQGMDPARRYYFPVVGHNFRLTNVACAILCAQLERVDAMIEWRRRVLATYAVGLAGISGIELQPVAEWALLAPWLFSLTVNEKDFGASRDQVMAYLERNGVETRPFFVPLHTLPPYRAPDGGVTPSLPHTVRLATTGLNLPTHSQLDLAVVQRIARLIREMPR